MDEKMYRELLSELGIVGSRTGNEIREHLEIKLNEYLERPDGDRMVERIEDALEYLEKQIEDLESGLEIKAEKPAVRTSLDDLKGDGKKQSNLQSWSGGSQTSNTSSAQQTPVKNQGNVNNLNANQSVSSNKWFVSLKGNSTVDNQFVQAEDCLKYEQWDNAIRIFNSILSQEARNPGAHLGIALAKNQIHEPSEIGSAVDKPLDVDIDLRKAHDFGNSAQAKYIEDALKERANQIVYQTAYKMMKKAASVGELRSAAQKFSQLGDYRDAKEQAEECLRNADTKEATEKEAEEKRRKEKQEKDDLALLDKLVERAKNADHDKANNYLTQIKGLQRKSEVVRKKFSDDDYRELEKFVTKGIRARKKERNRVDRRDKQKGFNAVVVLVLLIVCTIPAGFPFVSAKLRDGEQRSWPIIPITARKCVVSVEHSWLFTLADLNEIQLENSGELLFDELNLIMPRTDRLSNLKLMWFDDRELNLEIPAEHLELEHLSELVSLQVAEGTKEVSITGSGLLSELVLPDSVTKLSVIYCDELTRTDLLTAFADRGIEVIVNGTRLGGE